MFKGLIGQVVGVVSIALWLGMVVYFMSRSAVANAPDAGNWFIGFVLLTVLFLVVMTFWNRIFVEE